MVNSSNLLKNLKQSSFIVLLLSAVALTAISKPVFAQISEFKITSSDAAAGDWFGHSVSISGDYAIVGAQGDDDNGSSSGSAYVYSGFIPPDPFVANRIPDVVADEDFGSIIVALLDTVFDDPDLPDNDSLRFSAAVSNSILTHSFSGDTLFLHSVGDSNGVAQVIVTATDDSATAVSDTFTVTVSAVNDAPVITSSATATGTEDVPFSYTATATDVEGATLTFTYSSLSNWLSASGADVTGTPTEGVTSGSFRVIVSDGSLEDTLDVNITVEAVNDPPILSDLPDVVFNEDETAVVHFSDWFGLVDDPDNADSTLQWSFNSSGGDSVSFVIQGDSVIFEAPQDWFAFDRDTLKVRVSDGSLSDSTMLAVHVMPVNDAPMFVDFPDSVILEFGQSDTLILSDFVLDIDDPDSLLIWAQFACVGLDSIICVTTNADTVFIDPVGNFSGTAEFEFWVSDTSGASDTVSIIIYVLEPVGINNEGLIPQEYSLSNNYPNPFNPQTTISYGLPQQSDLTLIIYNIMGQEIMRWDEQNSQAGFYRKIWNGRNKFGVPVVSGVYFYRIIASDFVQTKKMVLLK